MSFSSAAAQEQGPSKRAAAAEAAVPHPQHPRAAVSLCGVAKEVHRADERPALGRHEHLAALCHALGARHLEQRAAGQQELPSVEHAADVQPHRPLQDSVALGVVILPQRSGCWGVRWRSSLSSPHPAAQYVPFGPGSAAGSPGSDLSATPRPAAAEWQPPASLPLFAAAPTGAGWTDCSNYLLDIGT